MFGKVSYCSPPSHRKKWGKSQLRKKLFIINWSSFSTHTYYISVVGRKVNYKLIKIDGVHFYYCTIQSTAALNAAHNNSLVDTFECGVGGRLACWYCIFGADLLQTQRIECLLDDWDGGRKWQSALNLQNNIHKSYLYSMNAFLNE